jgi:FPC/CPF motif-containing protein YcgG
MDDARSDARLLDELHDFGAFVDALPAETTTVHSLAAVFEGPRQGDEARFETRLWALLQRLHDLDHARGSDWSPDVSTDPDSPRFSLSIGGHPFFVIGLHPGASRIARRFEAPALVFNSHRQFNRLRADGRYGKMQAATRGRDLALQGSLNPNLADFGSEPETRQYSGRAVEPDWRCPFHVHRGAPN